MNTGFPAPDIDTVTDGLPITLEPMPLRSLFSVTRALAVVETGYRPEPIELSLPKAAATAAPPVVIAAPLTTKAAPATLNTTRLLIAVLPGRRARIPAGNSAVL